ncbi:Hypothetical predicted protein, partial [Pelobates cultripes]
MAPMLILPKMAPMLILPASLMNHGDPILLSQDTAHILHQMGEPKTYLDNFRGSCCGPEDSQAGVASGEG